MKPSPPIEVMVAFRTAVTVVTAVGALDETLGSVAQAVVLNDASLELPVNPPTVETA